MRLTFNVLHDPWIPMANGERHSLLSALENAAALPGVLCASPLETCAVYRLMIAFAMDALHLRDRDERAALLKRGAFDMRPFREYIERCESEGASFDLFDARRPFMQSAYDAQVDGEESIKPATNLVFEIPQGNNHLFFCHRSEVRLLPDEALRCLLSTYLFCPIGGSGYPAALNATKPCIYVLHQGDTLFETLVLNMLSIKECGNTEYGKPAWRAEAQVTPRKEFAKVDILQGLTWRPRRVTLICEDDGYISLVYWKTGHRFTGDMFRRDPHVPYCKNKDKYTALIAEEGRAFWRELGVLVKSKEGGNSIPPWVVENTPQGRKKHRLIAVGPITERASFLDILEEKIIVPDELLNDEERGDILREDLQFLENCAAALRRAADSAGEGGRSDQKSFLAPILQNTFFQMAHDYILGPYLEALTGCESEEDYLRQRGDVHEEVLRMLLRTLDKEKLRLGDDAKNLQKQVRVHQIVMAGYSKERKKREDEWK